MDLILIHGLGRTPLSLLRLRRHLRRAGHRALLFGYSPTFETLQGATARLLRRVEHRIGGRRYALVGHSLGTVLIRHALRGLASHPPAACFFLAPPLVACRAAKFFTRFRAFRLATGEMGRLLADDAFMEDLPMPPGPLRIYAGTAGPRAAWLPFGDAPNDGILSVAEATRDRQAQVLQVPALHTFIMNAPQVRADILATLARLEAVPA